eukprot:280820-Prymnesium_polylepis.1
MSAPLSRSRVPTQSSIEERSSSPSCVTPSSNQQAISKQSAGNHLAISKQPSGNRQAIGKQSSCNHQTIITNTHLTMIRQSSCDRRHLRDAHAAHARVVLVRAVRVEELR